MLSITIHDNADRLRLQLDGVLAGPAVRELELCWRTASSTLDSRSLEVDLGSITSIDERGRAMLDQLYRAGAAFLAARPETASLIEDLTGHRPAVPREQAKCGLRQFVTAMIAQAFQ